MKKNIKVEKMEKENFEGVRYGDAVRVQYRRRSGQTIYDRVGLVMFKTDNGIDLLSCKTSHTQMKKKSLLRIMIDLWQGTKDDFEEKDSYLHIMVPYDSIFKMKILERNKQPDS